MVKITVADRDLATKVAIEAARKDLLAFIMLMDPYFQVGPHHRVICDALMDFHAGKYDRLMIFAPPRSSKSMISSVFYPAWCFGLLPAHYRFAITHSQAFSDEFSGKVRNLVQTDKFKAVFPDMEIDKNRAGVTHWFTTAAGEFFSAGVGSKIAGHGAHEIVIDDPITEQEYTSDAVIKSINDWYGPGLYSRLQPGGRICLTMTRWRLDDLAGYLLDLHKEEPEADRWHVISLPIENTVESCAILVAATEKLIKSGVLPADYPMPEVGGTYWPAPYSKMAHKGLKPFWWSPSDIAKKKANNPQHVWNALYMQNPTHSGGGIMQTNVWPVWDSPDPVELDYMLMSCDTAYGKNDTGAFSATSIWGIFTPSDWEYDSKCMILLHASRSRAPYDALKKQIIADYKQWRPDLILIEDKASGQSILQDLQTQKLPVAGFKVVGDKKARAWAASSYTARGLLYYPAKDWALELVNECANYPDGKFKDYGDTVSQAVIWLRDSGFLTTAPKEEELRDEDEDDILDRRSKYY